MNFELKQIQQMAATVRQDILTMIHAAGSGHPGGSLSSVEILTTLYLTQLFHCDPAQPDDPQRDRFVLSKGHCAPVLYSVLCRRGFFPAEGLLTLRKLDSAFQGHPHAPLVPGIDCSSGSLGQGLSIANGMAMGLRRAKSSSRVYCLLGDGELQEGQVWEAALTAAQHKLSNVCAIVDNNHVQLDGRTEDIKRMEPVTDKWAAFGWNVLCADGHDPRALYVAYLAAMAEKEKPSVIVADTVKGKGVSFMEDDCAWHGQAPSDEQFACAMQEIQNQETEVTK
ncbi:MAG: transketolase [Ruthenibacterium sp.]